MSIDETSPVETAHLISTMFEFFKLPRELRDRIYDKAGSFHDIKSGRYGYENLRIKLEHWPEVNLLLVNQQFREELLERAQKVGVLCIRGTIRDCLDDTLPSIYPLVHRADINISFPFAVSGYTIDTLRSRRFPQLLCRAVERVLRPLSETSPLQEAFITIIPYRGYTSKLTQDLIAEGEKAFAVLSKENRVKAISVAHAGICKQIAPALRSEYTTNSGEHAPNPAAGC